MSSGSLVSSSSSVAVAVAAGSGRAQPLAFTVSQWHELEHQALIFKYLKAGLPVPPDLLAPIRRSLELISSRLFHLPSLGYCSYYGKKIDPEPGRCRRTDGKKWRCSKDAHPDSKYCERHMNRSRYRSRKPVESQTASQSLSTVALDIATGSSSGNKSFQNHPPLQSLGNHGGLSFGSNMPRSQMEPTPYGIGKRDYRSLEGQKSETKKDILPIASGSERFGTNSSVENSAWCLTTSQNPSYPLMDQRNTSLLQNSMQFMHDFDPLGTSSSMSREQQQQLFFGRDFDSSRSTKQDNQSLQPLANESKTLDFGYYLDDERAHKNSLYSTQLSMSIPMVSADQFFERSAHSSKDTGLDKFLT